MVLLNILLRMKIVIKIWWIPGESPKIPVGSQTPGLETLLSKGVMGLSPVLRSQKHYLPQKWEEFQKLIPSGCCLVEPSIPQWQWPLQVPTSGHVTWSRTTSCRVTGTIAQQQLKKKSQKFVTNYSSLHWLLHGSIQLFSVHLSIFRL